MRRLIPAFISFLALTLSLTSCDGVTEWENISIPDMENIENIENIETSIDSNAGEVADTGDNADAGEIDNISDISDGTNAGEIAGINDEVYEIGEIDDANDSALISETGVYSSKEDVALYIHVYGHLPDNFITKEEARELGWTGGGLEPYAPGKCIGGSHFGNYEGVLPTGHTYAECDIDTLGANRRGAKRLVYSTDLPIEENLIYYTEDHYETFETLYGEDAS